MPIAARGAASRCACRRVDRAGPRRARGAPRSTSTSRRASALASTCAWPGRADPGLGGAPAGDLFLEIEFSPHPRFRVDGRDVYLDLPLAPWEAALGATVDVPTPEGGVQLTVPPGSAAGRKLRLQAARAFRASRPATCTRCWRSRCRPPTRRPHAMPMARWRRRSTVFIHAPDERGQHEASNRVGARRSGGRGRDPADAGRAVPGLQRARGSGAALGRRGRARADRRRASEWRFAGASLRRTRVATRLARDFELNPPGVALALDLLDEIEALRAHLRRLASGGMR